MSGKQYKPTVNKSKINFSTVRVSRTESQENSIPVNGKPVEQPVKVYDLIDQPVVKEVNELCEEELLFETEKLLDSCKKAGIQVRFPCDCNRVAVYEFITKEVLHFEAGPFDPSSQVWNIEYEPFNPGQNLLIRNCCSSFLDNWLHQKLKAFNIELAEIFVTNKGTIKTKQEVLDRLKFCFKDRVFSSGNYSFSNVGFNWDEENNIGTGHAEGVLKYLSLSGQEKKYVDGSFKFYLINENGEWEIFYFLIPGFSW